MNWLKRGTLSVCALILAATAGCDDEEGFTFNNDLTDSTQACDPGPQSGALAPGLPVQGSESFTVTHLPSTPPLVPAKWVPANTTTTQKKRLRSAAYRIEKLPAATQTPLSGECRRF